MKREYIIKNQWERIKHKDLDLIISKSVEGVFKKKNKWKVIIPGSSLEKPKIIRGFSTKHKAYNYIKTI